MPIVAAHDRKDYKTKGMPRREDFPPLRTCTSPGGMAFTRSAAPVRSSGLQPWRCGSAEHVPPAENTQTSSRPLELPLLLLSAALLHAGRPSQGAAKITGGGLAVMLGNLGALAASPSCAVRGTHGSAMTRSASRASTDA